MLLNELALTREMMLALLGSSIRERRKNHYYSVPPVLTESPGGYSHFIFKNTDK